MTSQPAVPTPRHPEAAPRGAHRLWAPRARTAVLQTGNLRIPLEPAGEGFFLVPTLAHGQKYCFVLDDGAPMPDPRSRFQPEGVDGPSQWVDPSSLAKALPFRPEPLSRAVLYELHVGTFTAEGTFDAALARLSHLVELGITHVQLMPVAAFMGEFGWGYDGVSLFAVHAPYGGPEGLARFVRACHALGLGVLLDVVYNHLGPSGNYLGQYGPYFTDRYHTAWGTALNFDGPQSDEVRRFFIDNAKYWLREFGIDGLRLDAVQAIFDSSARHFLEELATEVSLLESELGRPLVLIAESHLNDPRVVRPVDRGGRGMHSMWSDDFHHALHALLTGERAGYYQDYGEVSQLKEALRRGFYFDGGYCGYYQRRHGAPAVDMQSHQFLVYLQNHDQVGNRAKGDRIGHGLDLAGAKLGAAATLLGPFLPMLFQGEEWGTSAPFPFFADPPHDELAQAIIGGRLREYEHFEWDASDVPDPTSRTTFLKSKLNWAEIDDAPHADLLTWYRALIALRKETEGCVPRDALGINSDESCITFIRGEYLVVLHFGCESLRLSVDQPLELALASSQGVELKQGILSAPGRSAIVLSSRT